MPPVILVSKDRDFTDVVRELARQELGVECQIMENEESARAVAGALIIDDKNPPFRLLSLLARIKIGMDSPSAKPLALSKNYYFSPQHKQLTHAGKIMDLTDKESDLLKLLIDAGENGMGKEQLLKQVWGFEPDINTHTLETHIYRLRGKFKELSGDEAIEAFEGGYKIRGPE